MNYEHALKRILKLIAKVGEMYYLHTEGKCSRKDFEEAFALLVEFAIDTERILN